MFKRQIYIYISLHIYISLTLFSRVRIFFLQIVVSRFMIIVSILFKPPWSSTHLQQHQIVHVDRLRPSRVQALAYSHHHKWAALTFQARRWQGLRAAYLLMIRWQLK